MVVKDIEDNATIVGNPARIDNMNQPGRFIKNRWIN